MMKGGQVEHAICRREHALQDKLEARAMMKEREEEVCRGHYKELLEERGFWLCGH